MKFDIVVCKDPAQLVWKWGWAVHAPQPERSDDHLSARYSRLLGGLGRSKREALDHGHALTSASANRKAKRAARRCASGMGGGTYEYKTKGAKESDRDDLLETIARLEEELGL